MSDLVDTVPIDLRCGRDGCTCRERNARIDYYAFRVYRKLTGRSLLRGVDPSDLAEDLPELVYAVLLHEDPELTVEHVEQHLTLHNAPQVLAAIVPVMDDVFPERQPPKEGTDPLPKRRPARARGRPKS